MQHSRCIVLCAALLLLLDTFQQCRAQKLSSREVDTRVMFELVEGQPPGTVVGTVPIKPGFTYRFNEVPKEFHINGTTGVITTAVEIDREALSSDRLNLVVLATHATLPMYPIEIRINVADVNDNSPVFPEASVAVTFPESASVGTRVILDTARDADAGANDITTDYRIVSGNEEDKFRLAVTTNPSGEMPYLHLETTGSLDRETRSSYQLNVSAQDGGKPPRYGYLQVNVTILDVNDNPPIFDQSDYSVSLNESVAPGTVVLNVSATDSDVGDNARISYFLSETESQFVVDPQTGVITTMDRLSCQHGKIDTSEKQSMGASKSCVFTVFARDYGSPRQDGRAYVTVTIEDANDHDPVIRFGFIPPHASFATVDEDAQNGWVVASVSVIDNDEGLNGQASVKISAGNELNHFRLEPAGGFDLVRVNGVLDRERVSKYNLTVVATDRGTPPRSSISFLLIQVNDVNDHEPIFDKNDYSAILSETVSIGTYVAGITATDEDTGVNSRVYYDIVSGNERQWFGIDFNTGLVTTKKPLNREEQDYVELKISARDGGPNPKWAYTLLKVQILDDNDEVPTFPVAMLNVSLTENAPANTLVTVLVANDNDLGTNGSVIYMLHPEVDNLFPNTFHLDPTSGKLSTKISFDREVRSLYPVRIIAKDQGQPPLSSTATVMLHIVDQNDNQPILYPKHYFIRVDDGSKPDTLKVNVLATDLDDGINAMIRFKILSGAEGRFEIDETTGVLRNTATLKLKQQGRYEITVVGYNEGHEAKSSAMVVVFVRDPSRTLPFEFKQSLVYNFSVQEDFSNNGVLTAGKEIGRVQRIDGARYSIISGDPYSWFRIDPIQGVVSTARAVDRETMPFVRLEVVANTLSHFSKTFVNINITDINDNAPSFVSSYHSISVPESWPMGLEIYVANASDNDYGENARLQYKLGGDHDDLFQITKETGILTLKKSAHLMAGQEYHLEIIASDSGVPPLSSRQTIAVTIEDVNDHTPMFDHMSYETSLLELTPVNERFFSLWASDADFGENGRVSYNITSGNEEAKFGIFPDGFLYVKNSLDREYRDYYSLTVVATDNGKKPRSSAVSVIIHIIDENDNAPEFENKTFEFHVFENEPPDTYVGKLSADDLDRGRNAEITYSINSNQNDFSVDPKTGYMRTLREFDREKLVEMTGHDYIVVEVAVTDSGISRLRSEATVIVRISDVNDNSPAFIRTPYKTTLSESAPEKYQVLRVTATDLDDGENGNLIYTIVDGNRGEVFDIDESTGQIRLLKQLDRETASSYILTVIARDAAEGSVHHTSTTSVLIQILDENDNAPQFLTNKHSVEIPETTAVGYKLHKFKAIDADLGTNGEVSYGIAAGNVKETFKIDSLSGILYLDEPLDYEQQGAYYLNITASDGGSPRLVTTQHFIVKILDVNDNAPQFPSIALVRQIEENIPVNTPVITVTATDKDSKLNSKLTYSITEQEPNVKGSFHFRIRQDTGVIYTAREIDREFSSTFKLTVSAKDHGTPPLSSEKIVTIIVEDVNDNSPSFTSVNAGTVFAGSDRSQNVMTISATDPDANSNGVVTYELIDTASDLFALDRNSGELYLTRQVTKPEIAYKLTVQASDEGVVSHRRSSTLNVTVLGISHETDNGLKFTQSVYTGSVYENESVGTSVVTVKAVSVNGAGKLEYYLTSVKAGGTSFGQRFEVNPKTGIVTTAAVLDREEQSHAYELEIYVTDRSSLTPTTMKTKVTIRVLDRNDSPPRFIDAPYHIRVSEDTPMGSTLTTIHAQDPDDEGSVTFSVVTSTMEDDARFQMDPHSGIIILAEPLDRETTALHKLTIRASDGIQQSDTTLTVEVMDTNDNPPVFSESVYSFDMREDVQRGAQVGLVTATDADLALNRQVSYSVLSDWGNDLFSLNPQTGVFTLTSHLDYEQYQHYVFVVLAQDSGSPSLSSTVTVYMNVLDLNDNTPLFDPMSYSDEIPEDIPIGSSVVKVSATDLDTGDNGRIVYQIVEGNEADQFAVSSNGTIYTTRLLDREEKSLYTLIVSATDQAWPIENRLTSTVQVTIILKDVNDMSPEFVTPNVTSVAENVPINTIVMAVKAIDKDEGKNSYIEYSLHPRPDNKFTLGPVDGLLRVSALLDREIKSRYEVRVVAKDKGNPARSAVTDITVNILDENDNSPAFEPRQYSAAISENASIGLSVVQITATDQDIGVSGQVRYSIVGGDPNHDFEVAEDTGIVRVRKGLDYERKNRYVITVQAEDCSHDVRYDTTTVTISLTDINDNPPVFLDSPYEARVVENALVPPGGTLVIKMEAIDADIMSNQNIHYLLKDGDRSLFRINSTSGELFVLSKLDREQQNEHIVTVLAMDSGTPRQTGTGTVTIIVSDMNDNIPRFDRDRYSLSVMENQPAHHLIGSVIATDLDSGLNGQIRYKLSDNHNESFVIDPDTGELRTTKSLDREAKDKFELTLFAQDQGATVQHHTNVSLTILILDENDNAPTFAHSQRTVYVPDNANAGHFVVGSQAIDYDYGLNSRIVYHLSGTDADKFQIDQDTGVVKLVQRLSKKPTPFEITVHATDHGNVPLSSSTKIDVRIEAVDLFPVFGVTDNDFELPENLRNHTITRVRATSPRKSAIVYGITGGNIGNSFSINSTTGIVVVSGKLDYEVVPKYELWIEARDSEKQSLSSVLMLNVRLTDANDNVPVFMHDVYNASVLEEQFPPELVTTVKAIDLDSGDNGQITYQFQSAAENSIFTLDAESGKIFTSSRLDREMVDRYKLIVEAVDKGTPPNTGTATIIVTVTDKNDNPPRFTRLFSVNVTENAPLGSFVIQATSSDRDIDDNANATYSLSDNPGEMFSIDPLTGKVTVAGWIDREVKDEYLLKVTAVDGSWKADTPLTITVQDINDNSPKFERLRYHFNVPELQQPISFVGKVTAIDKDKVGPNSLVTYQLRRPSDLFRVDSSTGEILTKQVLTHKKLPNGKSSPENQHVLKIIAKDHGKPPLSSEVAVYIAIVDANNNIPSFSKKSFFSPVPETYAPGLPIIRITAEDDEDIGFASAVSYTIVNGNGTDLLSIHEQTGWVTLKQAVQGHRGQFYEVIVQAADKGVPPRTATVSLVISVTIENHHAPIFTASGYQIVVTESEPLYSEIIAVTATDQDVGVNGQVAYFIEKSKKFAIDPVSGAVTIAEPLDYEDKHEYNLQITAKDMAFYSKNTTTVLTVLVTDVNDCPPVFNSTLFEANIFENEPAGTYVTQLTATDADSGHNNITQYALVGTSAKFFHIDPHSGIVTSKASFNFEDTSMYKLEVVASNPGTFQYTSTKLVVYIQGRNEFFPRFVSPVFQFTASESDAIGTPIGTLFATDEDAGVDGEVLFLFVGASNDRGFKISPTSGEITVAKRLDRESEARVVLAVLAKNHGSIRGNDTDEAQVVISIQDGNDPPIFLKNLYEAKISEAVAVGTPLLTVTAIDKDVRPNNNQFFYSIVDGNRDKVFSVDTNTGIIQTAGTLDRETVSLYNLTVAAIDNGSPAQTGTVLVHITVEDVNDNSPHFDTRDTVGYVPENEPPYTSVMVLSAKDNDLPPFGAPYSYFIVGGPHRDLFEIDKQTGLVRTTQLLDRETLSEAHFQIEVHDNGTPPLKSRHQVRVIITDKNDSPSSPRSLSVEVWCYRSIFPGGKIADVRPIDPDSTGDYRCRLDTGDSSIFSVIRHCSLHSRRLDHPKNYTLSIQGNDGRHADVVSTISIEYKTFDNSTLYNSITLLVRNTSADTFLSTTYPSLLEKIRQSTMHIGHPVIFSMTAVNDSEVQVMLAIKRRSNSYLTPAEIIDALKHTSIFSKNVLLGYDPCDSGTPCQNGGQCRSRLDQKESLTNMDSTELSFTSPAIVRSFVCTCQNGFSGKRCEDQKDPCSPNPCASGATCHYDTNNTFHCACPPHLQGRHCESQRSDTCASSPCRNGGTCRESPGGSFFCLCRPGFKGSFCEQTTDACRPNRCLNGGTCVNEKPGYRCVCAANYFGRHCESSTHGFHPYSYMGFPSLRSSTNDISIVFATSKRDGLLAYNYGIQNGGRSDFVALEIIDGYPRFSFGGSSTAITTTNITVDVADGNWHKVTIIRNGRVASLSAVDCTNNGELCEDCSHSNSSCSVSVSGQTGTLSFGNNMLYIGGVPFIDAIMERPGQIQTDDFVGCINSVSVNGRLLDLDSPVQSQHTSQTCPRETDVCTSSNRYYAQCKQSDGVCIDNWFSSSCICPTGILATECNKVLEPYSLGSGSFLELAPREKHRRIILHSSQETAARHPRSIEEAPKTFSLRIRTKVSRGLIFLATTEDGYTSLQLNEGHLIYVSQLKPREPVKTVIESPYLADGVWHTIVLTRYAFSMTVGVDEHLVELQATDGEMHDFLDPFLISLTIGGHWEQNSVNVMTDIHHFHGCLQQIVINGELQTINSSLSTYFNVIAHGTVHNSCSEEALGLDVAPTDPLNVGIILVLVFFVILIVVILGSFIMFRQCRIIRDKTPSCKPPEIWPVRLSANLPLPANNFNIRGSNRAERPEHAYEEATCRPHEIVTKKQREPPQQRPDIIERQHITKSSNTSLSPHRLPDESTMMAKFTPPLPKQPEQLEHYDLENASSIAPSDIDVVYHYKMFRDGSNSLRANKFKSAPLPQVPTYHSRDPPAPPPQYPGRMRDSPRNILTRQSPCDFLTRQSSSHTLRESPASMKLQNNTPLARLSPSSEISHQAPRILTLQDISGKPLQSALLASHSGAKELDPMTTNSERTLSSPVSHTTSSIAGPQKRKKILQAGDVASAGPELPYRARNSSLLSALDTVSSDSDDGNTEKNDQVTEIMETNTDVRESSSDESGNDSFSCSEFEYDSNYEKIQDPPRHPPRPPRRGEDSKIYDAFESFRGSLGSFKGSAPPPGSLGWDCLLNWGPNFDNLVGVFNEIGELPDVGNPPPTSPRPRGESSSTLRSSGRKKPNEEYV